jgi:hypothetical protein
MLRGNGETMQLGPFLVDREGLLRPRAPGIEPAFAFRSGSISVQARLVEWRALRLSATLGRVPFTAEDREARSRVFAALVAARHRMEDRLRLRLDPNHAIRVETLRPLSRPVSATALLSTATGFVLVLTPILRLLEENGASFN